MEIVRDAKALEDLLRMRNAVFRVSARLPDRVWHAAQAKTLFFDGDYAFDPASWAMVSSLARLHADQTVSFATVEPDADFIAESCGHLGAFTVESDADERDFLQGLFGDDPASPFSLAILAETVALFGPSGRWGIWIERGVAGLVSSEAVDGLDGWFVSHGPFFEVGRALTDLLPTAFGGPVPPDFADRLEDAYERVLDADSCDS